jgi:hypothetical protein
VELIGRESLEGGSAPYVWPASTVPTHTGKILVSTSHWRHRWTFVLAAGLVAGTLDIVYACLFWALKSGVPAQRILQSVAAGLLGSASFEGGALTAALGLALHYLIALSMAGAYFLAAQRWAQLVQRPFLYGAGYGLLLYVVMNYVVIPLSAADPGPQDPVWITLTIIVHALLVGVPIALLVRRAMV